VLQYCGLGDNKGDQPVKTYYSHRQRLFLGHEANSETEGHLNNKCMQ